MPNHTPQRLVGVKEAAAQAGKSVVTIRRWITAGVLTEYRDGPFAVSPVLVDLDELDKANKPRRITPEPAA